MNIAIDVYCTR